MHAPHVEIRPDGDTSVVLHSREIDALIDSGEDPAELGRLLRESARHVVPELARQVPHHADAGSRSAHPGGRIPLGGSGAVRAGLLRGRFPTPNGFTGTAFYLARHAHRFQAIIRPTDDAAQGDRMQFELATDTGSTLFTSQVCAAARHRQSTASRASSDCP
jgi:hypothetical protein